MKYLQYNAISGTNNDLEILQDFMNIGYYNDTIYWAVVSGDDLIIKSSSSLTASSSTEHTYDMTQAFPQTYSNPMLRILYINSKWYLCAAVGAKDNAFQTGGLFTVFKNLSDSGAYVDDSFVGKLNTGGAFVENTLLLDIFSFGSNFDIIYYMHDGAGQSGFRYANVAIADGSSTDGGEFYLVELDTVNSLYSGCYNGTNYIYYIEDNSNDIRKVTVPSNYVESTAVDATLTFANSNPAVQKYWVQDKYEWIVDAEYFYFRNITESTWSFFTDTGTTTNAVIWRYNSSTNALEMESQVWKDSIFWFNKNNLPLRIQSTTANAYVGWAVSAINAWFANGADTIYQATIITLNAAVATFTGQLQAPYDLKLEIFSEPATNQWLRLYTDADVSLGYFKINSYKTTDEGIYQCSVSGGDAIDLRNEPDQSYTATDAPDIIIDTIDFGTFFYENGHISTTPATTYNINMGGKAIEDIFRWASAKEGYIVSWTFDYEVYFDQYSDIGDWEYKLIGDTPITGVVQFTSAWNEDYDYKLTASGTKTAVIPDWTTDWTSDFDTDESVTNNGHLLSNHLTATGGARTKYFSFTAKASDSVEGWIDLSQVNEDVAIQIRTAATVVCQVIFAADGNVDFQGSGVDDDADIQAYTANTQIHWRMDFDNGAQCDLYINGTKISDVTGGAVNADRILFNGSDGADFYIDAITDPDGAYVAGSNRWRYIDGFVDENPYNCPITYESSIGNHEKVLKLTDNNIAAILVLRRDFTASTTGTIDLFFRGTDTAKDFYIGGYSDDTWHIGIRSESDKIQYYYGAAWHDATSGTTADNTIYHVSFVFDCATDTYSFYLNGSLLDSGIAFVAVATTINRLRFSTATAETSIWYINALGISTDGYTQFDTLAQINRVSIADPPTLKKESLKYSKIKLYGGFLNGVRLTAEVLSEPSFGTYYDWFPEITNQTDLDAMAATLATAKNLVLQKLSVTVTRLGWIRPGLSLKVYIPSLSLINETMYVVWSQYDALTGVNHLLLTDAVYIPPVNQQTQEKIKIQNTQNQIAAIENKLGKVNTIAADDTTPDVSGGRIFITSANTGATAITDLDNPEVGAIYYLLGGSDTNSTTITDGGNFRLNGNMTLGLGDSIMLFCYADNDYWEMSRTTV